MGSLLLCVDERLPVDPEDDSRRAEDHCRTSCINRMTMSLLMLLVVRMMLAVMPFRPVSTPVGITVISISVAILMTIPLPTTVVSLRTRFVLATIMGRHQQRGG